MIELNGMFIDPMFRYENGLGRSIDLTSEDDVRRAIGDLIDPDGVKSNYHLVRSEYHKCVKLELKSMGREVSVANDELDEDEQLLADEEARARAVRSMDRLNRRLRSGDPYTKAQDQPRRLTDEELCAQPDVLVINNQAYTLEDANPNRRSPRVESTSVRAAIVYGVNNVNAYMMGGDHLLSVDFENMWAQRSTDSNTPYEMSRRCIGGRCLVADLEYVPRRRVRRIERQLRRIWYIATGADGDVDAPTGLALVDATAHIDTDLTRTKRVKGRVPAKISRRYVERLRRSLANDYERAERGLIERAREVFLQSPLDLTILRTPAGVSVRLLMDRAVDLETFKYFQRCLVEVLHMCDHVNYYMPHRAVPCLPLQMQYDERCIGLDNEDDGFVIDPTCLKHAQLCPVPWSVRVDDDGYETVVRPLFIGRVMRVEELYEAFGAKGELFAGRDDFGGLCLKASLRLSELRHRRSMRLHDVLAGAEAGAINAPGEEGAWLRGVRAFRDALAPFRHTPRKWAACIAAEKVMGEGCLDTDWYHCRFDKAVRDRAYRRRITVRQADAELNGVDEPAHEHAVEHLDLDTAVDWSYAHPLIKALHRRDKATVQKLVPEKYLRRTFKTRAEALRFMRAVKLLELFSIDAGYGDAFSSVFYEDVNPSAVVHQHVQILRDGSKVTKDYLYSYAPGHPCGDAVDVLRCACAKGASALSVGRTLAVVCDLLDWLVVDEEVAHAHTRARLTRYRGPKAKLLNVDRLIDSVMTAFDRLRGTYRYRCLHNRHIRPLLQLYLAVLRRQCYDQRCCRQSLADGFCVVAAPEWLADAAREMGVNISDEAIRRHVRTLQALGFIKRLYTPKQIPNTTLRRTVTRDAMRHGAMTSVFMFRLLDGEAAFAELEHRLRRVVRGLGDVTTPLFQHNRYLGRAEVVKRLGRRLADDVVGNVLHPEPDEYQRLYGAHAVREYGLETAFEMDDHMRWRMITRPTLPLIADYLRLFAKYEPRVAERLASLEASDEYRRELARLERRRRGERDWSDPGLITRSQEAFLDSLGAA